MIIFIGIVDASQSKEPQFVDCILVYLHVTVFYKNVELHQLKICRDLPVFLSFRFSVPCVLYG